MNARHVLVTGAGSGVGKGIAERFAADGAALTLAGRSAAPLQALAASLPRAQALTVDVTDAGAVSRLVDTAQERFGPLQVLVANAGAADSAPLVKTGDELWQAMLAVNLSGVFYCLRAALPGMLARGEGRLVAVASTAGLKGYPYVSAYCAAKHGVVGLVRAAAQEVARSAITVNAVCPGFVDTPLLERSLAHIAASTGRGEDAARRTLQNSNPQGRFVTVEEVAATVCWLASPAASAVNGQALAVAGGEL